MPVQDKQQPKARPHSAVLQDRTTLQLTGVTDIDRFDEQTVVVYTDLGELVIQGTGLHIGHLNVETGELQVTGRIASMTYIDQTKPAHGFWARLFR